MFGYCILSTIFHRGGIMSRLRDLRQAKGWTQAQLGKHLGLAKTTISGYEKEEHYLDPPTICAICDLFGCTADYLLGRSDAQLPAVTAEQAAVLRAYDSLPLEIRKAVDGLLAPYMGPEKKKETA